MHRMIWLVACAAFALSPSAFGTVILTVNGTAPASNVVLSNASNASFLRLLPNSNGATADEGRGQTFVLPDAGPAAIGWNVTELTLQKNGAQTVGAGSKLYLWVFEYNPANDANAATPWSNGGGIADGDPFNNTGISVFLVNKAEFAIGGASYTDGQYLHLTFSSPLTMAESKAYGFYTEFTGSIASAAPLVSTSRFQLSSPSNTGSSYAGGTMLTTTPSAHGLNAQDFSFHVVGTAVPEPGTAIALFAAGAGLLLRRRRVRL